MGVTGLPEFRNPIDAERLRGEELDEYERLNKAFFSPGDFALLLIAGVTYAAAVIVLAVMSEQMKDAPDDLGGLLGFLGWAVLFVGWYPVVAAWGRASENAAKAREDRLWKFGRKIGAIPKYIDPNRRSGGGGSMSLRQMQSGWYGSHSELDWTDRVRGEMYGMDVDTYISNVAEHDKD